MNPCENCGKPSMGVCGPTGGRTRFTCSVGCSRALQGEGSILREVAEIIRVVLLTHEGKTITPELARERANNAAQALGTFDIRRRP